MAMNSKSNEEIPSREQNKDTQAGLEEHVFDMDHILSTEELEEASTIHIDEVRANFIRDPVLRKEYFKEKKEQMDRMSTKKKAQSPIKLVPGGNYASDENEEDYGYDDYEDEYKETYGDYDLTQIIAGLIPKKKNFRLGKGRKRF